MHAVVVAGTDTVSSRGKTSPLADVVLGGITLLQRVLRSLARAGVERAIILAPDPERVASLAEAEGLGLEVEVHGHDRVLADAGDVLAGAIEHLPERFWLVTVDRMVSPGLFPAAAAELDGPVAVVDADDRPTGVWVIAREQVAGLAGADLEAGALQLRPARHDAGRAPWHPVHAAEDLRPAFDRLLASLRKPLGRQADGIVAYYLNRPVSVRMSRVLVGTGVTPNQITALGLVLGLLGAVLAALGDWGWMVLGGVALQISSIVDGVDGEIARMRLTMSHAGEWFDTVCDDVINVGFMVGLGVGTFRQTGEEPYLAIGLGGAAIAVAIVTSLYFKLARAGLASHNNLGWGFEGDGDDRGLLWLPVKAFSYLAKRDSYTVLLLLLLLLDLPVVALLTMVGGVALLGIGLVIQLVTSTFAVASR